VAVVRVVEGVFGGVVNPHAGLFGLLQDHHRELVASWYRGSAKRWQGEGNTQPARQS
jgi:hypothetical protein